MSLKAFLHQLHYEPDKVKPPDWEADWDDAPLPYKLYRGLPTIRLSAEVPLTLEGGGAPVHPDLHTIGHFLWYVYGLAQVSQTVHPLDPSEGEGDWLRQIYRRFIPSGGGLYPNELYMYLKLEDAPVGIYHYDVAHHRLIMLREGNMDSYLSQALGNRYEVSVCFGVAFVSTFFWKNFFKYNNFSYRLQGLDAGVLIGQLLEMAKRFGYTSSVYVQFLDRAVNHLLGLKQQEESVYAVIPLMAEPANPLFACSTEENGIITASELCLELPELQHDHYVHSLVIKPYPTLIQMNEASMQEDSGKFQQIGMKHDGTGEEAIFTLPSTDRLSYDLAVISRKRYSPEADYVLHEVQLTQLAALLQEATTSFVYHNDIDGEQSLEKCKPRVDLYGCFYGIEDIPDGAYRYDGEAHELRQVRPGDHRSWLQHGMSLDNINLFQVPLCFHVVGDRDNLHSQLGYRGHRIQQMEAGMLVQRLLLAASALGLGGRPLLGFDANVSDDIYKLAPQGMTSLIQIPVGSYRGRPRLEGSFGR